MLKYGSIWWNSAKFDSEFQFFRWLMHVERWLIWWRHYHDRQALSAKRYHCSWRNCSVLSAWTWQNNRWPLWKCCRVDIAMRSYRRYCRNRTLSISISVKMQQSTFWCLVAPLVAFGACETLEAFIHEKKFLGRRHRMFDVCGFLFDRSATMCFEYCGKLLLSSQSGQVSIDRCQCSSSGAAFKHARQKVGGCGLLVFHSIGWQLPSGFGQTATNCLRWFAWEFQATGTGWFKGTPEGGGSL